MENKQLIEYVEQYLAPYTDIIKQISEIPEEGLTENIIAELHDTLNGFKQTPAYGSAVQAMIGSYKASGTSRTMAKEYLSEIIATLKSYTDVILSSVTLEAKRELINEWNHIFVDVITEATGIYTKGDVEVSFELMSPSAKIPTYAHDGDACADVYSAETVIVPAHAMGQLIKTGIKCALPYCWEFEVRPRSGMSSKSPIRIANAPGTIDSGYRGEICVIVDNISDEDYTINQGDRIAQLALKPVSVFSPVIVSDINTIVPSSRGENGFGSTGK